MFRNLNDISEYLLVNEPPPPVENNENSGNTIYKCQFCDEGWTSETEVDIHFKYKHTSKAATLVSDKNKHVCAICIQEFHDRDQLVSHIKHLHLHTAPNSTHVKRKIFFCDHCSCLFFNKHVLALHLQLKHQNVTSNTQSVCYCFICNTYLTLLQYRTHDSKHSTNSVSCCQICYKKQKNKKSVLDHVKQHPVYLFCDICQMVFNTDENFERHYRNCHESNTVAKYNGRINKFFLPHASEWKYQVVMRANGLLLYNGVQICVLCRKVCSSRTEKILHICRDHSGSGKWKQEIECEVCGEKFGAKILLKHHQWKQKGKCKESDESINNTAEQEVIDEMEIPS